MQGSWKWRVQLELLQTQHAIEPAQTMLAVISVGNGKGKGIENFELHFVFENYIIF